MGIRKTAVFLLGAAAVLLWGCGGLAENDAGEDGVRVLETTDFDGGQSGNLETGSKEAGKMEKGDRDLGDSDLQGHGTAAESEQLGISDPEFSEYVGIKAHIKEVKGDSALISSDSDGFPGVFRIDGWLKLTGEEELNKDSVFTGGTPVYVVMADTGQKTEDGKIAICKGLELYLAEDGDEGQVRPDILFTQPPALGLTDVLSGVYGPFQVLAGNYSWNTDEGDGTMKSVIACGSGPLDQAGLKSAAVLEVKKYNQIERVMYAYDTVFFPDKLVIRQWDRAEAQLEEAGEERIITCYDRAPFLLLEKGKVYEIGVQWNQENFDKNGFWGEAAYVFVTE